MNQKTTEFIVGIFMIVGFLCFATVAVKFGSEPYFSGQKKLLYASFDSIAGLKKHAPIEVAGVPVGKVTNISLKKGRAWVEMELDQGFEVAEDAIVSVRTKGIIGEKYIKLISGASDTVLKSGEELIETESVVDIEELIGKFIYGK